MFSVSVSSCSEKSDCCDSLSVVLVGELFRLPTSVLCAGRNLWASGGLAFVGGGLWAAVWLLAGQL